MNKLMCGFILFFVHNLYAVKLATSTMMNASSATIASRSSQLSPEEFTKKYWKDRDNTPIIINDYLSSKNRVDIDNKNFFISYNSDCFTVGVSGDYSDEIKDPIKELRGLNFTRNKKCIKKDQYVFTDKFFLTYLMNVEDEKKRNTYYTKVSKSPLVMMQNLLKVNSGSATVISYLYDGMNISNVNFIIYYKIFCPNNNIYEFSFTAKSYQEQLDFVTKHNYKLPDDIMQIISTFRCRKDR